jgi:hypothetical protein
MQQLAGAGQQLQQPDHFFVVARMQILGLLTGVIVGVAGQRRDQRGPVHADASVDAPALDHQVYSVNARCQACTCR